MSVTYITFLVIYFQLVNSSSEPVKVQTCKDTREPFQVTYSWKCDKVCVQPCGESTNNTDNCAALPQYCEGFPSTCTETGCKCSMSSFARNDNNNEITVDDVVERITCEDDVIKVFISKCAVNELGFTLGDFYVNGLANSSYIPSIDELVLSTDENNTCLGGVDISSSGLNYLFQIKGYFGSCNGNFEVGPNFEYLKYSNAIKATTRDVMPVTSPRQAIYIMFSCAYYTGLGSVMHEPTSHDLAVYSGKLYDDFNVKLDLWEDMWFGTHYVITDEVEEQDYIYVTVKAFVKDSERVKVQILEATVTSSYNIDDVNSYPLIVNGCINSNHTSNHDVTLNKNGNWFDVMFKFRVFRFHELSSEDDQEIYVHVVAHLCEAMFEEESCLLDCKSRRRRSLDVSKMNVRRATSPPIKVTKWRRMINETGRNITVMQALDIISESWEVTLMVSCILLLIFTLMISMCILLVKVSKKESVSEVKEEK